LIYAKDYNRQGYGINGGSDLFKLNRYFFKCKALWGLEESHANSTG
jgi:hypothetical protein